MEHRLVELIREAFSGTPHPGDGFLLGSREGEDASEAMQPFRGSTDWSEVDATTLDRNYEALSFLSEGGFRFFLPAYLVADIKDELRTADPVFHLTGGFSDKVVRVPVDDGVVEKRLGRSVLVNPRRFGALTFEDHARFRLSAFTREESEAIVSYLEYRRGLPDAVDAEDIEAALDRFWRDRAIHAPGKGDLAEHLDAEDEFLRQVAPEVGGTN